MSHEPTRPCRPVDLQDGDSFEHDLAGLAQSLMDEPSFRETGRNAATLIQGRALRVTVTVIRAGTALAEHQAGRPTHFMVLDGEIEWTDSNRAGPLVLTAGRSIAFGGALRHRVAARRDSTLVLVFGSTASQAS